MSLLLLMGDSGFNPRTLFANGEQGAWYDPSDFSTMFTDSAGTTPVTAVGDLVGRINDKSGRGNNAVQATSGNRPSLARVPFGGARNILSSSEPMATQTRTVTAVQHTLSFQGTGTVTLSGVSTAGPLVGTGASDIVSLSFTPTAGSLTLTVSGTVTLAQLEIGAARSNYQKVVTAGTVRDITESGKADCYYLDFASNKSLATSAIDFSATDEMTVIAGVRTLASTDQAIVEASANYNNNIGTFILSRGNPSLFCSGLNGNGAGINFATVSSAVPKTDVVSQLLDNSATTNAGENSLRLNGVDQTLTYVVATPASNTGNFGNNVLYIASRAGSSLYFTGHIYQLIIRGKTTADSVLRQAERHVATRTGVTI